MMEVKVTWWNNNPFADIRNLSRTSEAELDAATPFYTIEAFAKEATPDGYWLKEILLPSMRYVYFFDGSKKAVEVKK